MPTPEELDRIHIVLVPRAQPQQHRSSRPAPCTTSACAICAWSTITCSLRERALRHRCLRDPRGASPVPASAEAIADCHPVVGTTAGRRARPAASPSFRCPKLYPASAPNFAATTGSDSNPGRVALLFGSEKTGLSNDELSHCNWLLTVPMRQREGRASSLDEPRPSPRRLPL